jgi:predicted porin
MENFSMKKTLIALAAVAATSAAFAQSSVTVFGVLDAGYNNKSWKADGGFSAKGSGVVDGGLAGSRFGFRGVEDLGGGLKAEFMIEQGLSPTSQGLTNARTTNTGFQIDAVGVGSSRSATSLNRQSYLGLSGGFGTVRLGYQYTNVYEVSTLSGYSAGTEGVHGADFAHVAGAGYVGGTRANAITYISPNFSGFTAQFQYGAGAGLQSFETNSAATGLSQFEAKRTSIMGKYAQGPLSVALAYTAFKNGSGAAGASAPTTVTANLTQLGASYDLKVAKLNFTYNTGDNDVAVAANKRDVDAYTISASVPFGSTSFVAAYHNIDEDNGSGADVTKGSGYQFGVVHNLSKRTAAYAFYGRNSFDTTTSPAILKNLKQRDITVGVRHSF